jgi:hypothetical protein
MRLIPATLSLLLASAALAAEPTPPKGFTPIFNGKDLSGWHGMPHEDPYAFEKKSEGDRKALIEKWSADAFKHWKVENGDLVNDGHGAYMTTDKDYGDIELLIDYKTVAQADSGIYLRATPQVQIWDYTKEGGKWNLGADKGSGGLWNNSPGTAGKDPLVLADKPFGEWNSLRIIQVGQRTTVYLNGKLVVENAIMENFWNRALPLKIKGPIQLQTHGGEIRWKNIFVREIPATEANAILAKRDAKAYSEVFNGKDFTGWSGATKEYEVKDGAIVSKPGHGGNLFTTAKYENFSVRLEYRLPEGGNNGLAIRYPGKGLPSEVGMCEIQILDDTAKQYEKLDKRQYNGSVYGMIPATRGYLRPVGEWNFMEVTVNGPKIQVELNGNLIVNGDVSKVKETMGKKEHPGKDNKDGHFGFAGHSDPVVFRNVQIKTLK